jgi:hypothetical protein
MVMMSFLSERVFCYSTFLIGAYAPIIAYKLYNVKRMSGLKGQKRGVMFEKKENLEHSRTLGPLWYWFVRNVLMFYSFISTIS